MDSSSNKIEGKPATAKRGKLRNVKHASGDGFWAWVVVAGGALYSSIRASTDRCYSVFYFPLMRDYNIDFAQVSQLFGAFNIGYACSGLIVPVLTKYWTNRKWMMTLGVVVSLSAFISSFRIPFMGVVLLFGFVPGFCFGIQITLVVKSISASMHKHRTLALQLVYLGISVGTFVGCPAWQILISAYTWTGVIFIMSGVYLNLVVSGATMRSLSPEDKSPASVANETMADDHLDDVSRDIIEINPDEKKLQSNCCCSKYWKSLYNHYDLFLFCHLEIYLFMALFLFFAAANNVSASLLIPFGVKVLNVSAIQASFLPSALAVGEITAKITNGLLFDRIPKSVQKLFFAGEIATMSGVFFALSFIDGYVLTVSLCVLVGFLGGASDGLFTGFMVEVFGARLYPSVNSYMNTAGYVFVTIVALASGELIDRSGNVANAFYIASACYALSAAILVILHKITLSSRKTESLYLRTNSQQDA